MPNLSIKNVPESVVEKLRRRATRNHRSMQGELMALVCQVVEKQDDPDGSLRPLRQTRRGTKSVEEIWEANRARRSVPVSEGPRAVDIIRADRDGR